MKVYLAQHAKAVDKATDPQRPLSREGKADIEAVAQFLRPLNLAVYSVWHSGKKRAQQTAEILAKALDVTGTVKAEPGLAPNDEVLPVKKRIETADEDIVIVGHQPFMGKLASLLLTSDESAQTVIFHTGGVVALVQDQRGCWQIDWIIPWTCALILKIRLPELIFLKPFFKSCLSTTIRVTNREWTIRRQRP